jgi:hypothetical protein
MWRWKQIRTTQDDIRLKLVCDLFTNVSSTHNDSRVPVRKAGRGTSDKSHCVVFCVRVKEEIRAEWQPAVKDRTATVPMSQLLPSSDGGWTVPRWVLERKLDRSKELFGETSVWNGLAPVIAQLQAAFDAASASVTTAVTASQEREQVRRRKLEDEKSRIRSLAEEDGELALAFARRRLRLSDITELGHSISYWPTWLPGMPINDAIARELAELVVAVRNHPKFATWRQENLHRKGSLLKPERPAAPRRPRVPDRIIENCTVEWTEWLGTSNSQRAIKHRDDGCTVRLVGQKHEIELPDGSVVNKMAGSSLRVIEHAPAMGSE